MALYWSGSNMRIGIAEKSESCFGGLVIGIIITVDMYLIRKCKN